MSKPIIKTKFRNHMCIRISSAIVGIVSAIWIAKTIFKFLSIGLHAIYISDLLATILALCIFYFSMITNFTTYYIMREKLIIKCPLAKDKIYDILDLIKIEEIGKIFPHLELQFKGKKKIQKCWIDKNQAFVEILLALMEKERKINFNEDNKKIIFS